MGVPTTEVGFTSTTTGRGDHEFLKVHVVALGGGTYLNNAMISKLELRLAEMPFIHVLVYLQYIYIYTINHTLYTSHKALFTGNLSNKHSP
jgi:hypothetical protein